MASIGSNNIINTQMQANMPSPAVQANANILQSTQNPQNAGQKAEVINDSFSYSEAPLNVGVLEGPSTYSKTPISDELQRRAQDAPMEKISDIKPEKDSSKPVITESGPSPAPLTTSKKQNGTGNLSAILALGSMVSVFLMTVPKLVYKIIKHK